MDASSSIPDITAFYIQEIGALLFGLVFLFLTGSRGWCTSGCGRSRGCCAFWPRFSASSCCGRSNAAWLAPYATFEFAFVIVLISAARAGFASDVKDWRTVLRLIAILPIFVALVYAIGQCGGHRGVPRVARHRAGVRLLVQLHHAAASIRASAAGSSASRCWCWRSCSSSTR